MPAWIVTAVHWFYVHYHKNWVDALTWLCAAVYTVYRTCRTGDWKLAGIGRSFMDGAAVFPLLLLALAAIWRTGVQGLLEASRPTLSIAGIFALTAVLQVDSKESDSRRSVERGSKDASPPPAP